MDTLLKAMVEKAVTPICTFCTEKITEFKDVKSEREFLINGCCQQCQDKFNKVN